MDLFPLLGFIDIKTALVVAHLVGVALGAGVALFSAAMFMKVMYDGKINKTELGFIELASTLVAIGLSLLVLSGLGLFALNPEHYLASSKFLAKMTIIAVLIVNGTLIHTIHVPALKHHVDQFLPSIAGFTKRSRFMYAGGAVSMSSWLCALALGVFDSVPYAYTTIMTWYGVVIVCAVLAALILHHYTFGKHATHQ